jgi:hypothetical protein
MTNRTLCLKTLWLLSIPVLLALPSAAGEKPGPKFEFKDKAALDVDARCPARLSPDGKTVLYVRKVDGGKDYAYFAVGADGSVIFPDGFPKSPKDRGETWSCTLRRVSPQGKVSTVIELKDALLLVDRSGSTGLFANLETRKLVVAKIEAK